MTYETTADHEWTAPGVDHEWTAPEAPPGARLARCAADGTDLVPAVRHRGRAS
ncbi:hypothetical protein [Streptomyces sp. NPDC050535]|uniref:hypothetical protein n=1 Tax=Streptomyces sp. NPDC050535 TaxID=3365626 RepID=UPI00379E1F63